ncbi:AraC family transcriptional regulator [Sporosarcina sp. Marseille-Q4063]|uniref:helix-turn-helix domain-containing protein n=1 Tax=Sporosarcina sp. Marseille-Q4063 TaxID=2810514 RepID=UPI00201683FA|nr:AraC family transcriptional regulator [Sporosarcina sp. Marseille-Q4063]
MMGENPVSENKFVDEIKNNDYFEVVEQFFETEEKLLKQLYRFEKKEAKNAAKKMIEIVSEASKKDNELIGIKYYLIALTGIIARHIRKEHSATKKALSFNATSLILIEQRLTIDNAENLADELIEFFIYIVGERKPSLLMHHTVNKVVQYIDKEVEVPMSVEGLSEMFDVSTSHLSRIFREHTGITLVEYINVRKVEESQYYLRFSDMKISDVSDRFNFCNQSYFTRIFKKYTGETPRRFRNNLAGEYFRLTLPLEEK